MTGPACGNNPNYRMSDGDRRVVESFRAYLAARAALIEAADWYAQQGKTILAAAQVATDLRRRAGAEARHVDGSTATETDEQRADREETERDHARGDHTHCGVTCEVELPTEHLRNFVIAKGYPGTKGALAELERRAADTGGFELRGDTEIRAAALREAADEAASAARLFPDSEECATAVGALEGLAERLRRVADETAATERCPRSEFDGYGLQCQKPAGHNLCTFEEQPAAETQAEACPPGCIACATDECHDPAPAAEVWRGATEVISDREVERLAATGLVGYRQGRGRLLHCLHHKPVPASRWADFHEVTADDLPDGGICVHPRCGADLLAVQPAAGARQDGAQR